MEPSGKYRIECKNHAGNKLIWTSLNSDGSQFDRHGTEPGHDRHLHLPAATANVRVQQDDAGQTGLWCGSVNDGDHLVADGVWPVVKLKLNNHDPGPSTC